MENRRAVIWSVGAAFIAIIAYWMIVDKAVQNETRELRDKQTIIVATVDIPANTRIKREMLGERADFPRVLVPPETAVNFSEVENQVAIATIKAGEPLMRTKVVPFDESALNRRIPDGMRAVTIGIRDDQDVIGVAGHLRPGMFVDVLVTLFVSTREIEKGPLAGIPGADQTGLKAETRTIFQNVKIIAVGRDARLQTAQVARPVSLEEDLANKNVTVVLKPDEAQKLVLAQAVGRITLVLRNFNDNTVTPLDYIDALRAFGIKLPIVSGPPPAYREIRGGQVVNVQPF